MSARNYSSNRLLWYKAGYSIIVQALQKKYARVTRKGKPAPWHLQWRLAYNLYCSGAHFEADTYFRELLEAKHKENKKEKSDIFNSLSRINQLAGRNSFCLYLQTDLHFHLENAHAYYQKATENMQCDLSTMIILPLLLLEFGFVLEAYGSFESAMEIYGKIIRQFPTFRGYFDTLYRSAIVGKHLADVMPADSSHKEETIKKCIDIMQFLLEALPLNINGVHAVLMYARILECSANPQVSYGAKSVYVSLFNLCKKKKLFDAHMCTEGADSWLSNSEVWTRMAESIRAAGEPLVANEAFRKSIEEHGQFFTSPKESSSSSKSGVAVKSSKSRKSVKSVVDDPEKGITTCLTVARHFAKYQNWHEAIKFAEKALEINKYHREVRSVLSKWSTYHAAEMQEQSAAVQKILDVWKGRCWTKGFCRRVKESIVQKMEHKLKKHPYHLEARSNLIYYSRDKWRAKFIFEDICAIRIQQFFREKKAIWIFQETQRQTQLTKTQDIYRRYLKDPWDRSLRHEVLSVSKHRLTPKKHAIFVARSLVEKQNNAMRMLEKFMRAHMIRKALQHRIDTRRNKERRMLYNAAYTIQHCVRKRLARNSEERRIIELAIFSSAAVVIQRFIRWRRKQFRYVAKRQMDMVGFQKRHAWTTLKLLVPPNIKRFLKFKKQIRLRREQSMKRQRLRENASAWEQRRQECAVSIQRFFRCFVMDFWLKIARRVNWYRRKSLRAANLPTETKHALANSRNVYKVPGISQNSQQFLSLASQNIVVIQGEFSAADCMMLSMVLKHKSCLVKHLVFDRVSHPSAINPCFEFDLLPAISKCKSMRKVTVIGGNWSKGFLYGIVHTTQVDNPRIQQLEIHCIDNAVNISEDLLVSTGRLLMDYFNYIIPGIRCITLHGCSITDRQLDSLASGLRVNSSLQSLVLSMNFISDDGFGKIFSSISHNNKSAISYLDCSVNYIRCSTTVRELLNNYESPPNNSNGGKLKVLLLHNSMNEYYIPQPRNPAKALGLVMMYFDEQEAAAILKKTAFVAALSVAAKAAAATQKSKHNSSCSETIMSGSPETSVGFVSSKRAPTSTSQTSVASSCSMDDAGTSSWSTSSSHNNNNNSTPLVPRAQSSPAGSGSSSGGGGDLCAALTLGNNEHGPAVSSEEGVQFSSMHHQQQQQQSLISSTGLHRQQHNSSSKIVSFPTGSTSAAASAGFNDDAFGGESFQATGSNNNNVDNRTNSRIAYGARTTSNMSALTTSTKSSKNSSSSSSSTSSKSFIPQSHIMKVPVAVVKKTHRVLDEAHRNMKGKLLSLHQLVRLAEAKKEFFGGDYDEEDEDENEEEEDANNVAETAASNVKWGASSQKIQSIYSYRIKKAETSGLSSSTGSSKSSSRGFGGGDNVSMSQKAHLTSLKSAGPLSRDAAAVAAVVGWSNHKY